MTSNTPSKGQLLSVCYSYRLDYGLLPESQKRKVYKKAEDIWGLISKLFSNSNEPFLPKPTESQTKLISEQYNPDKDSLSDKEKEYLEISIGSYWYAIYKELAEPSHISKSIDSKNQS